jgi:alpha-L-fucosidase
MQKAFAILILLLGCKGLPGRAQARIAPYGITPSSNQLHWQQMEFYMFAHFGPNTFTGKEWGTGKEDPGVFNPTQLNCMQWAKIARAAGMTGIILVAKHHDGFCLWPSAFSTHTVAHSKWRNGQGDVLKDLSAACRAYGLKLGIYISPWDRNHPAYGTAAYNQVFAGMLKEVLTHYGQIFEVWFDGANGEGPNGKKQVYDWALFDSTVKKYQPQAVIFNFSNTDGIRWVGNEDGYAPVTSWSRDSGFTTDGHRTAIQMGTGLENGPYWRPSETDVSIRPGWFYHPAEDSLVKSVSRLMDIYEKSVGRNSSLLLNVPPDRAGLIAPADSARLMQFRDARLAAFTHDLSIGATVTATATAGPYIARFVVDGNPKTYWASASRQAAITLEFGQSTQFNTLELMEYLPLGQRVRAFTVEAWNGKKYLKISTGTTIGHIRILGFPRISTTRLRIHILDAGAPPVISEVQVFNDPSMP